MRKILLTTVGLLVLIAGIAGIKALQIRKMVEQGAQFVPPPTKVAATRVTAQQWESVLTAIGSLVAVQGVTVAVELPGKVVQIDFASGDAVKKGDLLLRQDIQQEEARLPGAEAALTLARTNLKRLQRLLAEKTVSESQYDAAVADYQEAMAQADSIRVSIDKKSVRVPFAGRLGIRQVNLGQYLKEGDGIVSLQSLDPVFVDFFLPQQDLVRLQTGQLVRITTDGLPDEVFEGKITTIDAEVDRNTRNIKVRATMANPDERLRPGMYVDVAVVLPEDRNVLAIPATAVLYAPYSDSVFIVEEKTGGNNAAAGTDLRQQFVRLGARRGDFVEVTEGLKGGETIVSIGVFKLRHGEGVVIDNSLAPDFKLEPSPENR